MKVSNFIGDALDLAAGHPFRQVLLVGHIGKLVKLAGGVMNTHSRYADCRAELFCAHAACCGASRQVCLELLQAATADRCVEILDGAGLREPVLRRLLEAIQLHLDRRVQGKYRVGRCCSLTHTACWAKRNQEGRSSSHGSKARDFLRRGRGPRRPGAAHGKSHKRAGGLPGAGLPQTKSGEMLALDIVRGAMDVSGKEILPLRFAMSRDKAVQQAAHREAAEAVCRFLRRGRTWPCPTWGTCPSTPPTAT